MKFNHYSVVLTKQTNFNELLLKFYKELVLNEAQLTIVMFLHQAIEKNLAQKFNLAYLQQKMYASEDRVDHDFSDLLERELISLEPTETHLSYQLDPLYQKLINIAKTTYQQKLKTQMQDLRLKISFFYQLSLPQQEFILKWYPKIDCEFLIREVNIMFEMHHQLDLNLLELKFNNFLDSNNPDNKILTLTQYNWLQD